MRGIPLFTGYPRILTVKDGILSKTLLFVKADFQNGPLTPSPRHFGDKRTVPLSLNEGKSFCDSLSY